MGTAQSASLDAIGSIAEQVFDLLWGEGRDPIPTVGDHAYQRIWLQLITGARQPGEHLSDVELAASGQRPSPAPMLQVRRGGKTPPTLLYRHPTAAGLLSGVQTGRQEPSSRDKRFDAPHTGRADALHCCMGRAAKKKGF